MDDILVSEGKEPYFVPGMQNMIDKSGLRSHMQDFLKAIGIKDRLPDYSSKETHKIYKELSPEDKRTFEQNTNLSYDKFLEAVNYLETQPKQNTTTEIIKDMVEKEDPFGTKKK